ncbi:hypothetical protein D3C81_1119990 [compost metagenome]
MEHALQSALEAGPGHAVQQVPGRADIDALAAQPGRRVFEECGEVLRHLCLQLVECLLLLQQFRADLKAVKRALGMGGADPRAKMQHVAGKRGRVGGVKILLARQQRADHELVGTHVAQVALAEVRVDGMQVRVRHIGPFLLPHEELADGGRLFPLAHAVGKEGDGAGGAGGMADPQFRHGLVHRGEPVVEPLAAAHVSGGDALGLIRRDQLAQPLVDLAEALFLEQGGRIGFEDGVFEQQRDNVVELIDLRHPLGVGELLQHWHAVAQRCEALLKRCKLDGIDFLPREVLPRLAAMAGKCRGVLQQQVGFLF